MRQIHVLDLETLKSVREPIGLKECAPHAVAVVAVGSEIFVADGCEYCVEEPRPRGGSSVRFENAPTRVVVLSGAGELKRTMPLPTGHRYSGFQSLTALPSDKLLAVTIMGLVSMTTQGEILQARSSLYKTARYRCLARQTPPTHLPPREPRAGDGISTPNPLPRVPRGKK